MRKLNGGGKEVVSVTDLSVQSSEEVSDNDEGQVLDSVTEVQTDSSIGCGKVEKTRYKKKRRGTVVRQVDRQSGGPSVTCLW